MTKLANRVISIFDRKTSMRLAMPEWTAVDDICRRENIKRKHLFEIIDIVCLDIHSAKQISGS